MAWLGKGCINAEHDSRRNLDLVDDVAFATGYRPKDSAVAKRR
jgi:hypothetical protein